MQITLFSVFSFTLPFLPLIIFDFRHQFLNLHSALSFFSRGTFQPRDFYLTDNSLTKFLKEGSFIFTNDLFVGLLLFITIIFFVIRYLPDKKKYLLLYIIPLTSVIGLHFYSEGRWPEYYHQAGVIVFYFLIVLSLNKFIKHKECFILIILFVAASFTKTLSWVLRTDDPFGYRYQKELIKFILRESAPFNRPNITYDFPLGEGLGFGTIREYHEKKEGEHNPSLFFVSYHYNPKHNETKKTFGIYAVSKNWQEPDQK